MLATFGTLRASPGSAAALGGFFLLAAAVCYWGALSRFNVDVQARNRRVCATYAVALLLAGNLLLFPVNFQVPFLSLAAVTAAFLYVRTSKLSLGMHVSVYLFAAAILSGLLSVTGRALAGTVPSGLDAGTWVVTASAVLCYAIGWRAFDRSMETAAALDRPLRAGGWCGGCAGGDGGCEARFGELGVKRFASFGRQDIGDMLSRSHSRLRRLAFETHGITVGCIPSHSIWDTQTPVRGSSFRQCHVACGLAFVLRSGFDLDPVADTIWSRPALISVQRHRGAPEKKMFCVC